MPVAGNWGSSLAQVLSSTGIWQRAFSTNPLEQRGFHELSSPDKASVLYVVCDWRLHQDAALRDSLAQQLSRPDGDLLALLRSRPLGHDASGATYHHLPGWRADLRVYRCLQGGSSNGQVLWATQAADLQQLQDWAGQLASSSDSREQSLHAALVQQVLPKQDAAAAVPPPQPPAAAAAALPSPPAAAEEPPPQPLLQAAAADVLPPPPPSAEQAGRTQASGSIMPPAAADAAAATAGSDARASAQAEAEAAAARIQAGADAVRVKAEGDAQQFTRTGRPRRAATVRGRKPQHGIGWSPLAGVLVPRGQRVYRPARCGVGNMQKLVNAARNGVEAVVGVAPPRPARAAQPGVPGAAAGLQDAEYNIENDSDFNDSSSSDSGDSDDWEMRRVKRSKGRGRSRAPKKQKTEQPADRPGPGPGMQLGAGRGVGGFPGGGGAPGAGGLPGMGGVPGRPSNPQQALQQQLMAQQQAGGMFGQLQRPGMQGATLAQQYG
ncbi:hypothetical protein COO60DRAFT_1625674 [Scenedesmus sp. NREL 46B-D3]|nr:hypothetical protein COO60DRAFT_1625674 [Scenedesmus sp. NREL 46B-D3]